MIKFPKIIFVNELPQWIINSDIAAYHPFRTSIWIRNDLGLTTIKILLHELLHWFIHIFLNNNEKLHNEIDKDWIEHISIFKTTLKMLKYKIKLFSYKESKGQTNE